MKLIYLVIGLLSSSWVSGQTTLAKVQARFSHEYGVTAGAMQCYKGLLADDVEAFFCISQDQHGKLKGVYAYGTNGNYFTLEGEYKDGQQLWTEWDTLGQRCGMIILSQEDDLLNGWWQNNDQDVQLPLVLKPLSALDTLRPLESSISNYRIKLDDQRVLLTLIRDRMNTRGIWYQEAKQGGESWFIRGYCADQNCTKLELDAYSVSGVHQAEILIQEESEETLQVVFKNADNKTTYFTAKTEESLILDRYAEGGYRGYVNLNLPPAVALSTIITDLIKERVGELEASPEQYHASERMRLSANAWIEPGYFDLHVFSGLLILHLNDQKVNVPFLLDMQTGKALDPVALAGQFIENSKVQDLIAELLNERDVPSPLAGELTPADFKHPVFLQEGMSLCTDFNPVNGVQRVVVPYNYFGRELLKNELIKHLLR